MKCWINGCPHPELEKTIERISDVEEYEVICDNGVGFKHIRTGDGKHYAYRSKKRAPQTFETIQI